MSTIRADRACCSHPDTKYPWGKCTSDGNAASLPHRWYVEESWEYICHCHESVMLRFIVCLYCERIVYVERFNPERKCWFRAKDAIIPDLTDSVEDTNGIISAIGDWYDGTLIDPVGSLMQPEQLTNDLPDWLLDEDRAWLSGN